MVSPQPDHKRSVVLAVDMTILKSLENKALLSPCKCDLLEGLSLSSTLGKPMDIQFMKLYSHTQISKTKYFCYVNPNST